MMRFDFCFVLVVDSDLQRSTCFVLQDNNVFLRTNKTIMFLTGCLELLFFHVLLAKETWSYYSDWRKALLSQMLAAEGVSPQRSCPLAGGQIVHSAEIRIPRTGNLVRALRLRGSAASPAVLIVN